MRKNNKKLMIVVSVLLSLVLITSSVVSGTMAKYVTSASTSESARGAKWGVNVEVEFSDAVKALCSDEDEDGTLDEIVPVAKDGVLTVTLPNLPMAPGDDFTDAVSFKFSGKSEVRLKVSIDFIVQFNRAFTVPNTVGNFEEYAIAAKKDLQDNYVCMPIRFTANTFSKDGTAYSDYKTPWKVNSSRADIDMGIDSVTSTKLGMDLTGKYSANGNLYCEKIFSPGEEIVFHPTNDDSIDIDRIAYGLKWDFENLEPTYNEEKKLDFNEIETYILSKGPSVTVTYIIKIEQIAGSYTIPKVELG